MKKFVFGKFYQIIPGLALIPVAAWTLEAPEVHHWIPALLLTLLTAPILKLANAASGRSFFQSVVFAVFLEWPLLLLAIVSKFQFHPASISFSLLSCVAGELLIRKAEVKVRRTSIFVDVVAAWLLGFLLLFIGTLLIGIVAESINPSHPTNHCCTDAPSLTTEYNDKPVIYLYPQKTQDTTVRVKFDGVVTATYPRAGRNNSWKVTASPDGVLLDSSGERHRYLFWEGSWGESTPMNLARGFIVDGAISDQFLRGKLRKLGLTSLESDDFITYWYPILRKRGRLQIYFAQHEFEAAAHLDISPAPDSAVRFMMVFRDAPPGLTVKQQKLIHHRRKGFVVVEWGGMELTRAGSGNRVQ